MSNLFVKEFNIMAQSVHETALDKGWYGPDGRVDPGFGNVTGNLHAEISEAWEAHRKGNPSDDKIPEFSSVEVEWADEIIRIMDASRFYGYRVAEALVAKAEFNKSRPYRHGGKVA